MKKYTELSKSLRGSLKTEESYVKYDRDSFIKGDLFKVGDIVEHRGRKAEIINMGSNYVTLIREGKTFKSWITDIVSVQTESKRVMPRIVDNQVSFKGFKTTHFTEEVSILFLEKYQETTDPFAFYNCLVSCDSIMGASSNVLIEFYHKYRNDYDRVSRYLDKFDITIPKVHTIGEALDMVKNYNES